MTCVQSLDVMIQVHQLAFLMSAISNILGDIDQLYTLSSWRGQGTGRWMM